MLKIAVFAPIPSASVSVAIAVNSGLRRSVRKAKRKSWRNRSKARLLSQIYTRRNSPCFTRRRPLLPYAPRRFALPRFQLLQCPFVRLIRVACRAWIGHSGLLRHPRRNEIKRVRVHHVVAQRLLDFRHVAGRAFAARAVLRVVRVLRNRSRESRRILLVRRVAAQAQRV